MNRRIAGLLAAFGLLVSVASLAQVDKMGQPRSPNLETYRMDEITGQGDANYSGDLSLSIPLLTVPGANGHDFTITLGYSSSLTQRSTASWVGLGWNLELGSITRSVLGRLDEGPSSQNWQGQGTRAEMWGWLSGSKTGDAVHVQDQPDQYNIQMEGLSDQLLAVPTYANAATFYPMRWKPSWLITGVHNSGWLHTFTVRQDDGTNCTFGAPLKMHLNDESVNFEYFYQWNLRSIEYPDGASTRIVYRSQALTPDAYGSAIVDRNFAGIPTDNLFGAGQPAWPFPTDHVLKREYGWPDTLYTDTHYAVFLHSAPVVAHPEGVNRDRYERTDCERKLNAIVLYDRVTNTEVRRVEFTYATTNNSAAVYDEIYSTSNPDWTQGQRLGNDQLTLLQVRVRSGALERSPYVFSYAKNPQFNWIAMTNRGASDPTFKGHYPAPELGTAWRLQAITLPSGGSVAYSYEVLNSDSFKVWYDPEGNYPPGGDAWSFKAVPACRLKAKVVTDQMGATQSFIYNYGMAVYDPPSRSLGMNYTQRWFRGTEAADREKFSKFFGGCAIGHRWARVSNPDGSWKTTYFTSSYKEPDADPRESQYDSFLVDTLPTAGSVVNRSYAGRRGTAWKVQTPSETIVNTYDFVDKQTQDSRIEYFYLSGVGYWDYRHTERSIWSKLTGTTVTRDGVSLDTWYTYLATEGLLARKDEWFADGKSRVTEYDYAFSHYEDMLSYSMLSQLYSTTVKEDATVFSYSRTSWAQFGTRWLPSGEYLGYTIPILVKSYYSYDPAGRPLSVGDAYGNTATFYYGTNSSPFTNTGLTRSQLTGVERIVNGATLRTSYKYNIAGQITEQRDENDDTTKYHYDGLGRLVGLTGPNGISLASFSYSDFSWNGLTFVPNVITSGLRRSSTDSTIKRAYFDGVGYLRQEQTNVGSSDLVTAKTYDAMRRDARLYKPYEALLAQPHAYDLSFATNAIAYYSTVADTTPYQRLEYYADGTSRVQHVHAPGITFQSEVDNRFVRSTYGTNVFNEVPMYTQANSLFKTAIRDENGVLNRTYMNKLGNTVATIVDSSGLKLTTLQSVDVLGRVRKVWTPNRAAQIDSARIRSTRFDHPASSGSFTYAGLSPGPGRSVRVTLRNPDGGILMRTATTASDIKDPRRKPSDPIILAPQNGITVNWELRQYVNGQLQPIDPNLQYWQYIVATNAYANPISYGLYSNADEVRLIITGITYWDPEVLSSVVVEFEYVPAVVQPDLAYDYDEYGRLSKRTTPDDSITQLLYDRNGNLRLVKDANHTGSSSNTLNENWTSVSDPYTISAAFTMNLPGKVTLGAQRTGGSGFVQLRIKASDGNVLQYVNGSTSTAAYATVTLPKGNYSYEVKTYGSGSYSYYLLGNKGYEFVYHLYDALNREVESGEYESSVATSFSQTNAWNQGFPTSGKIVHRAMLYDVASTDPLVSSQQRNLKARLSQVQNYEEGLWHSTTFYSYDDFGRVEWIQHKYPSINSRRIQYRYDFQGNVVWTGYREIGASQNDVFFFYAYDVAGRLSTVSTGKDSSGTGKVTDVTYSYLANGKVKQAILGAAQTVDYKYNSRDWLTDINDMAKVSYDRFVEKLHYIDPPSGTAQYNGNISFAKYYNSSLGSYHGYGFAYDSTNRLRSAQSYVGNSFATSDSRYSLGNVSYDANGNITKLLRRGSAGLVIDSLTYNYFAGTNRLQYVRDTATAELSSVDVNNQLPSNYVYDMNGNMMRDRGSKVLFVTSNTENQPTRMVMANVPSGIVGWFSLDSTGQDETNNGLNLTPQSAVFGAARLGSHSISMNGTAAGGYAYTNKVIPLQVAQPTVEAWIKPTSYDGTIACMSVSGAWNDGRGYYLYLTSAGKLQFVAGNASGTWKQVVGATTIATNAWTHVAGLYDGTYLRVYVNGVLDGSFNVGSITISYSPRANSGPNDSTFYVGIQHNADNTVPTDTSDLKYAFNGLIDEVKVYNRALSLTEIAEQAQLIPRIITFQYDQAGNRILKSDSKGISTYYVLDASGRTVAIQENSTLKTYNLHALDLVGQLKPNGSDVTRYYYLKDHLGSIRTTVAAGTLMESDDFSSGLSKWTTVAGFGYSIENGALKHGGYATDILVNSSGTLFGDGIIDVKVRKGGFANPSEYLSVVFRYQSTSNYYYVEFYSNAAKIYEVWNNTTTLKATGTMSGLSTSWSNVRIEAYGSNVKVYWNGDSSVAWNGASLMCSGKVGFRASNGNVVYWDDFSAYSNGAGQVVAYDDYDPWGMVQEGRSYLTGGVDGRFKFTEKERDGEVGYDYFGARYYDARIGRWQAVDPLSDISKNLSRSPYHYCANNPAKLVDPTGMLEEDPNFLQQAVSKVLSILGVSESKGAVSPPPDMVESNPTHPAFAVSGVNSMNAGPNAIANAVSAEMPDVLTLGAGVGTQWSVGAATDATRVSVGAMLNGSSDGTLTVHAYADITLVGQPLAQIDAGYSSNGGGYVSGGGIIGGTSEGGGGVTQTTGLGPISVTNQFTRQSSSTTLQGGIGGAQASIGVTKYKK